MKDKFPPAVKAVLWSYDKSKMRLSNPDNRHIIIFNILNYGTMKAVEWLWQNISTEEIKEVIRKSYASAWTRPSLALWSLAYRVKPAKKSRFGFTFGNPWWENRAKNKARFSRAGKSHVTYSMKINWDIFDQKRKADLYFVLQKISLDDFLVLCDKKYPHHDRMAFLRNIAFIDGLSKKSIVCKGKKVSLKEIKKHIGKILRKYMLKEQAESVFKVKKRERTDRDARYK